jgi:Tfp pilus assembly protein, tip-associated adhesin PilY1
MKAYKKNVLRVFSVMAVMLGSIGSSPLLAQDIELFSGTNPASSAIPNVLIVLDNTSNWNGTLQNGQSAWDPELVALANSIQGLANAGFGNKIRVGMMMFAAGSTDGGYVRYAIRQMTSTNAAQLKQVAQTIRAIQLGNGNPEGANNPTYAQTMNEAYLYYFGKTPRAGYGDLRRDCGTLNLNNLKINPLPGYNLTTLGNYAYSGCGSDAYNSNKFSSSGSNAGVTYVAPPDVSLACQRNFIIFISNGPIANNDNGPGLTLLQAAIAAEGAGSSAAISVVPSGETGSNYADEWAKFLNQVKNVTTYTINVKTTTGQSANHDAMMRSMATNGGGDECDATDPTSIQACIDATFNKILSVNSVFASVSLPVSSYPQLQNLDQVYMGMFRPDAEGNPRWFGNMKQFKLAVDSNNNPTLVDANDSTAIDPTTGQVFNGKTSFWTTNSTYWSYSPRGLPATSSDAPDGPLVEKGGAAERLRAVYAASGTTSNVATRKVFTCAGCSSQTALSGGTDTSSGATSFSSQNASSLAAALRVTAAEAPNLIKWVRGENVDGEKTDGIAVEARPSIHGDVLHSRPVVLTLSPTSIYVFYGGNDGMIHAINGGRAATGGNELWSFIPEEFFPRLQRLRANTPVTWAFNTISTSVTMASGSTSATVGSTTGLLLGMYLEGTSNIPKSTYITAINTATNVVTLSQAALGSISGTLRFVPQAKPAFADGTMTVYQDPTNSKTYLFASMRRGGRFLYAFDITDPVNPQYLWRKGCDHAGISGNNGYGCDSGYDELGETWSEPRIARIGTSLDNQTVLIFGAGYDPTVEDPDPALANSSRTMGRGIFVVNAYTGAVIQQIRPTKMDYAVPSDITLIDFDGDGFLDRLYFGDTGGQVWRVDTIGEKNPSNWTTQRIASLGVGEDSGLSGDANRRKFLFSPDVVETAPGSGIYSILLASGDRENPLNGASARSTATTVVNRIYMLLDGAPRGSTVIAETNLEDRTTNTFTAVANNLGWYITLGAAGEKGTGSVVTLSGTSYIGTNYPVTSSAGACYSTVGNARFYTVDFLTSAGRPGGSTSSTDITQGRFTEIVAGGMPPSPVGTIIAIGNNKFMEAVIMGTRTLPVGPAKVGDRFRNYWYKLFDKK